MFHVKQYGLLDAKKCVRQAYLHKIEVVNLYDS